jgi:hypothetical protein
MDKTCVIRIRRDVKSLIEKNKAYNREPNGDSLLRILGLEREPKSFDKQPKSFEIKPKTFDKQPKTFEIKPKSFDKQPISFDTKPSLRNINQPFDKPIFSPVQSNKKNNNRKKKK